MNVQVQNDVLRDRWLFHHLEVATGHSLSPVEMAHHLRIVLAQQTGFQHDEEFGVSPQCCVPFEPFHIAVDGGEYRVDHEFHKKHVFGCGGQSLHRTTLQWNDQAVLVSLRIVNYLTYSDDSEDHESSLEQNLYLLSDGVVERLVFAARKKTESSQPGQAQRIDSLFTG